MSTDEAAEIYPWVYSNTGASFQNAHIQYFMYLDMHKETHAGTCRRVCTNIHVETPVPTGIILHICTQGNLQTCSTYMCTHRRRGPHRRGSHGNPCSDMYSPMGIHTHAGHDTDTFTCIQPQKALHASKQGIPWGWAQCPHPRWHRHEVINAANHHQLPRSPPATAGRGSQASRAWGCVPRCQQHQGSAHPIVPAGP